MYSPKVRHYLLQPTNGKAGPHHNGVGFREDEVRCRANPNKIVKNRVTFSICVHNDRIMDCHWEAFADPVAMAVCSWCVENFKNKRLSEVRELLAPEKIAFELGLNDELDIRAGCTTVIMAVWAAIEDYANKE